MNAPDDVAMWISEPLSWAEICARFPDEWVCLVEIDRVRPFEFEFRTARVVARGKTRRAPIEQARLWLDHYNLMGYYFTGRVTVRPPRPSVIIDDELRDLIRPR